MRFIFKTNFIANGVRERGCWARSGKGQDCRLKKGFVSLLGAKLGTVACAGQVGVNFTLEVSLQVDVAGNESSNGVENLGGDVFEEVIKSLSVWENGAGEKFTVGAANVAWEVVGSIEDFGLRQDGQDEVLHLIDGDLAGGVESVDDFVSVADQSVGAVDAGGQTMSVTVRDFRKFSHFHVAFRFLTE